MTVIPIVIIALGKVFIGLAKRLVDLEIRGKLETIWTTALLISARILKSIYIYIYICVCVCVSVCVCICVCVCVCVFPVGGKFNSGKIVYRATIFPMENRKDMKIYFGISVENWKQRF